MRNLLLPCLCILMFACNEDTRSANEKEIDLYKGAQRSLYDSCIRYELRFLGEKNDFGRDAVYDQHQQYLKNYFKNSFRSANNWVGKIGDIRVVDPEVGFTITIQNGVFVSRAPKNSPIADTLRFLSEGSLVSFSGKAADTTVLFSDNRISPVRFYKDLKIERLNALKTD